MQITGVMVLGYRKTEFSQPVMEWYCQQLVARGHKNVRIAYHADEPYSDEVLREMNSEGINTVVILPMLMAEGNLSVWKMPARIGMPDNSCSYTYLTGKHVAIRFSTVFGRINALSEALLTRLKGCGAAPEDGVLLVAHGSELSMNFEAADKHAWYISQHGYPNVAYSFVKHNNPDMGSAVNKLVSMGSRRIVVLPMFLFECHSTREYIPSEIENLNLEIDVIYADVLGAEEHLLADMDRKIPEKW